MTYELLLGLVFFSQCPKGGICESITDLTLKMEWNLKMLRVSGFRATVTHNKVVSVCNAVQKGKGHTFCFAFSFVSP